MNQQQSNTAASSVRRIHTLEEHRAVLKHVFDTAKERILIVSPFISNSALTADKIPSLITAAVGRNVQVAIYIDDLLNREADGTLKKSAESGISSLVSAGAKVTVVNGIHNKTLARDTNLIAEGSFNWLSAVRTAGGTHQREERTMIVEGDEVASMIEKELMGLVKQEGLAVETTTVAASTRDWVFMIVLILFSFAMLPVWPIPALISLVILCFCCVSLSKPRVLADGQKEDLVSSLTAASHQREKPLHEITGSTFDVGYIGLGSSTPTIRTDNCKMDSLNKTGFN